MATGRWLAKQRVRSVFIYKRNEQLSLSSCQTWKVIKVQQTTQTGQRSGPGGFCPRSLFTCGVFATTTQNPHLCP